jgi:hypothetical protein
MHRLLLPLISLLAMTLAASADFVSPMQLGARTLIAAGFNTTITGNTQFHTVREIVFDRGRIAPAVLHVVAATLAGARAVKAEKGAGIVKLECQTSMVAAGKTPSRKPGETPTRYPACG